jgi:hypothetical protein
MMTEYELYTLRRAATTECLRAVVGKDALAFEFYGDEEMFSMLKEQDAELAGILKAFLLAYAEWWRGASAALGKSNGVDESLRQEAQKAIPLRDAARAQLVEAIRARKRKQA